MNFVRLLLKELKAASEGARAFDAFSFPEEVLPKDKQTVNPISSTFTGGWLINIYQVSDGDKKDKYIYSAHGDGGVLCDFGGPFSSLDDAKEHFDDVEEGWTNY
jgi:hypothetical protein